VHAEVERNKHHPFSPYFVRCLLQKCDDICFNFCFCLLLVLTPSNC